MRLFGVSHGKVCSGYVSGGGWEAGTALMIIVAQFSMFSCPDDRLRKIAALAARSGVPVFKVCHL